MTIDAAEENRLISLDGAFNFRDLGGYASSFGGRVKWRRVFRSDNLCTLTDADHDVLASLAVKTVIDLRRDGELEQMGRIRESPAYSYHHLPMMDVPVDGTDAGWASEAYVAARYGEMLAGGDDCVRGVLLIAADPAAYPLVFHCAAGKDRTGIVSAILLDLLGVSRQDIIDDYMLTAPAMDRMVAHMMEKYPERAEVLQKHLPAITGTRPGNMTGLLALIEERHGSVEDYVRYLGVADSVPAIRVNLLTQL